MIDNPRIEYWLIEWARWTRAHKTDLGYPHISSPLLSGGESRRGEDAYLDQEKEAWDVNVSALDSLIDSLPRLEMLSVRSVYLGEPWVGDNQMESLEAAYERLLAMIEQRGVCI